MDTYKLSNIIKRDMIHDKYNRYKNVRKQKFSFAFIRDLCSKYYVSEWTEFEYCCRHEDYNCWIEAHSSWMKHNNQSDEQYNQKVYSCIRRAVNARLTKEQIGKRSMFIAENSKCIVVCVPLRDVSKSDHWLVFDKNKPLLN